MQSTESRITTRVQSKPRGTRFKPKASLDLSNPEAVCIALHRLEKRGAIRRLTRGLYDFPKQNPTIGFLSPSPDEIAKALSERDACGCPPIPASSAYLCSVTARYEFQAFCVIYRASGEVYG